MTFWYFNFFRKTLLDQSLWIFKWASWWCHPLTIFYSFHIQKWKNLIFQLWEYKTCLITTQSKWAIMFTLIHFDMGICFYLYELKISKFHIQYIWKIVRGWHDQLTHLNIHKDWSRSVFRKKCEISKCHIFLISYPIFIIFSLFCREKLTLSFKIDSILEWISPLRIWCILK